MRIKVCRECGEELDSAENDVTSLCDECWEDLTQEDYDEFEDLGDPLAQRDDEMGM